MDRQHSPAVARAQTLFENVRRTPMMTGGRLAERRRLLKAHIESAIEARGVPDRLAARIAFQLVLKCSPSQLGDERVWSALGSLVRQDVERLRQGLRLTDRLIRVGVPKLSADDMERLFNEMQRVDAKYGRTLAEAALDGADPREMARRYARTFTESVSRLVAKNPPMARTLARAAFRSRHPLPNALEYLSRFDALVYEFQGGVGFARTVAKAAFLAPDPVRTARQFVHDYHAVVRQLTTRGLEPTIARTLAGIASVGAEPLTTACTLVESFRDIEDVLKRSHPQVARSVALAACRATDRRAPRGCTSRTMIESSASLARSTRNALGAWRIRPFVLTIRSHGQGGFIAKSCQRMALTVSEWLTLTAQKERSNVWTFRCSRPGYPSSSPDEELFHLVAPSAT